MDHIQGYIIKKIFAKKLKSVRYRTLSVHFRTLFENVKKCNALYFSKIIVWHDLCSIKQQKIKRTQ